MLTSTFAVDFCLHAVALLLLPQNGFTFLLDGEQEVTSRCPANVRNAPNIVVAVYKDWCIEFHVHASKYWSDASTECKVRGGHLVQISDADMQAFLMTSLSTMGYGASGGVALWIGLNDRQTEGRWVWDNGTPLQGYTHWAAGETSGTAQHTAEDCVVLQFTDQGLWHDKVCHIFLFKADFICQYDASAAPTTTTTSTTTSTTSTTTTTTTTPATTTTVNTCPDVECDVTCPQGYSGLYLKPNGCIACSCL